MINPMTENATEEMLAMARRIAAEQLGVGAMERFYHDGSRDDTREVKIALAAIIETQRRDAQVAERYHQGHTSGPRYIAGKFIATAIRSGKQYGKE